MNPYLALADIPEGVVNDLKSRYNNISFENYGKKENNYIHTSKLSRYQENGKELIQYCSRGEFTEDRADIYRVFEIRIKND
jgi:hypothetical protein